MKIKQNILLLLIILVSLQLASCDNINTLNNKLNVPSDIIESIKHNRNFTGTHSENNLEKFKSLLYKYENFDDELPIEKIVWETDKDKVEILTTSEAIEDIEYMFRILKYSYAGYEYFGGDKTFLNTKEKIIQNINSFNKDINIPTLFYLISNNMNFIQDGHFSIFTTDDEDYRNFFKSCNKYFYLNNKNIELAKDNKGYFTHMEKNKYYLTSIDEDKDVEKYIKPTLGCDGTIVYNIGVLSQNRTQTVNISLKSHKKILNKNVLLLYNSPSNLDNIGYKIDKIDEIPIIKNRRMFPNSKEDRELDKFIKEASYLKKEDIIILDIRNNIGGSSKYPMNWFKNFTGIYPSDERYFAFLNTKTVNKTLLNFASNKDIKDYESINYINSKLDDIEKGISKEGWIDIFYRAEERINNDTLIIVLMDEKVASSGEEFIRYLRTLNNVLFIGTNTSGLDLIGGNVYWYLPNSNIGFMTGSNISLSTFLENIDGKGFYPDIWVNSDDIIDRTINFINKYDLKDVNFNNKIH